VLGGISAATLLTCVAAMSFGLYDEDLAPPLEHGLDMPGVKAAVGTLESINGFSDVMQIPGTDFVALVDDDEPSHMFVWHPPGSAHFGETIRTVNFPSDAKVRDAEGIAADGSSIYVIGSHSRTNRGRIPTTALLKLRWIHGSLELEAAIHGLRDRLEAAIPEVAAARFRQPDDGGLNIEGLAWDPHRRRLLLGLRGPLIGGRPAVVPIEIVGSGAQVDAVISKPIAIAGIEGFGIRAIQHDPQWGGFVLITGGVGRRAGSGGNRFTLWRWSGDVKDSARAIMRFPSRLGGFEVRPEGVSRLSLSTGESYILVVTDNGPYYWKIEAAGDKADSRGDSVTAPLTSRRYPVPFNQ
jgi:hypothetical protein